MLVTGVASFRLALALALLATPAVAAKPKHPAPDTPAHALSCAPKAGVLAVLADKYREVPAWIGKVGPEAMMLTQSPDGATWTWMLLRTNGNAQLACMLGAGTAGSSVTTGGGV